MTPAPQKWENILKKTILPYLGMGCLLAACGGAAIGVDSYYHGESADVLGNLVHDIGPAGCRFVQGTTSARRGAS